MKQFFITFFANLLALALVLGGPIFLILLLMFTSFHTSRGTHKSLTIQRGSILVFDLSINVTDSPEHASATSPLDVALNNDNNRSVVLRHLTRAIRKAEKDNRIAALLLTGSFAPEDYGTGYACLNELRRAIVDFRKSKKKVYAYLEAPSTKDYYVESAASDIYLNPFGEMQIPGLASTKTYFANALQKYGVNVQVTRVGKFKSAVEPFILNKMSDADREETSKLLGDLWGEFVNTVSISRRIDPGALQKLVDTDGYILPQHALEAKLVDRLAYFGDLLKDLGKAAPTDDNEDEDNPFKQVSIYDYVASYSTPSLIGEHGDEVAILYLEGEIVDGEGAIASVGGDRFASELRHLRADKQVKAVVLRVNSPGGSAYASEVIQREVIELKKVKPVIISMGNYAASGGYWISTYADRIFAEPNTLTGSIGVFGLMLDIQKVSNDFGITYDVAKTGTYADFESVSRPKSRQELDLAQARVDDLYTKFINKVATSRNLDAGVVQSIAQGRVWSGREAIKLGLVDEIGGLDKAVVFAAKKANLGSRFRVKEYPEKIDFAAALAILLNNQQQPVNHARADPLTQQFLRFRHDLQSLQQLNDPLGLYARLPLGWEIK